MITNIALVSASAHTQPNRRMPSLIAIADQLWAMIAPRNSSEDLTDEAVAILRSASATADMCEWAERYLCGMETADKERFHQDRLWQS